MTALANGRLVKEEGNVFHWVLDEARCPSYLICVAVGEFEVVQDGDVDGIPVFFLLTRLRILDPRALHDRSW